MLDIFHVVKPTVELCWKFLCSSFMDFSSSSLVWLYMNVCLLLDVSSGGPSSSGLPVWEAAPVFRRVSLLWWGAGCIQSTTNWLSRLCRPVAQLWCCNQHFRLFTRVSLTEGDIYIWIYAQKAVVNLCQLEWWMFGLHRDLRNECRNWFPSNAGSPLKTYTYICNLNHLCCTIMSSTVKWSDYQ